MYGSFSTLKKSSLLSLPFFMPLPVSTLAASILTSSTADSAAVEENTRVASHLSNTPSIGTEALTLNLMVLFTGVTLNTGTLDGACARLTHENITSSEANPARRIFLFSFMIFLSVVRDSCLLWLRNRVTRIKRLDGGFALRPA